MKKQKFIITMTVLFILLCGMILIAFKAHAASWDTAGNVVTTGQFIGTINNEDVIFKKNNIEAFRINDSSNPYSLKFNNTQNGESSGLVNGQGYTFIQNTMGVGGQTEIMFYDGLLPNTPTIRLNESEARIENVDFSVYNGKQLRIYNSLGSPFYAGFKAGNNTQNLMWTLPLVDGVGVLTSDGNGNLSWQNAQSPPPPPPVLPTYTIQPTQQYTVTATDQTIECLPNGWNYLPTAVGVTGKRYEFINPYNNICTVFSNGIEIIGNLNPEPKYKILEGGAVTIISNGTIWRVIK